MFNNAFQVLTKEQLNRVHSLSLQVLREKGLMFYSERALDYFKKHEGAGVYVDGQCVKFDPAFVEKCIAQAPSGFLWQARNNENTIYVGEGQAPKVHVMQNHGPVAVQERNGVLRNGTMQDVINFYKLGQTSKVSTIVGQVSVDPAEMTGADKQMRITHELLKHTDKPLLSFPGTCYADNMKVLDMLEVVLGKDYLQSHYCITASVCSLSPLQFAEESADCIIAYAERNQPVLLLCCTMLGVSTPMPPIEAAIAQNVEILGGLMLSQIVRPGVPAIYGTGACTSYMRTGHFITTSPDVKLVDRINMQLCQELYHVPVRMMSGNADSKLPDIQAGYETMQHYVQLFMSGTHMVNECLGILDGMMSVSYEKYVIDEELIERVHMMMTKPSTDDIDFDISSLLNVPHGEPFLMEEKTLTACPSQWVPAVSNWSSYDQWVMEGKPDILDRAAKVCEERIASAPCDLLGEDLNNALRTFIEKN